MPMYLIGMVLVHHRVNTLEHLRRVPRSCGVEIDVRDYDGDLRLTHEPFAAGDRLSDFLKAYQHSLLIVNTKCDGLEPRILECLKERRVRDFFFLDTALPTMVRLTTRGIKQFAVRYSEFEPLEFVLRFAGLVDWVWIDCFQAPLASTEIYDRLREHFRTCLVSPELEGHPQASIAECAALTSHAPADAVCTDFPESWMAIANAAVNQPVLV
jgi:hypothetical protein